MVRGNYWFFFLIVSWTLLLYKISRKVHSLRHSHRTMSLSLSTFLIYRQKFLFELLIYEVRTLALFNQLIFRFQRILWWWGLNAYNRKNKTHYIDHVVCNFRKLFVPIKLYVKVWMFKINGNNVEDHLLYVNHLSA